MISPDAVLRDLRRGVGVRRSEAPEAAGALIAAGVVDVQRGGWLRLAEGVRAMRAARLLSRLRIGPATTDDLARVVGVGRERARVLAAECGAVGEPRVWTGVGGKRAQVVVWRLP